MDRYDKKRLEKMHQKIDSLAKKGKLGWEEYKEYLDEIVGDGLFWLYQNLLSIKYDIKNSHSITFIEAKTEKIYDLIRFNTKSDFQISLKKIYDNNSCYQISKKVYSTINNSYLGQIYQESVKSATQSYIVDTVVAIKENELVRYEDRFMPLIDKYKSAIEFIVS
jgi:hypothetical protein